MNRDHGYHQDHHDEHVRQARQKKHEQAVRDEQALARRRMWAFLNTSGQPSSDFPGCVE